MRIFVGSDVHGSSANVERFFATVDAYRAQHGDAKVVIYTITVRAIPCPKAMLR